MFAVISRAEPPAPGRFFVKRRKREVITVSRSGGAVPYYNVFYRPEADAAAAFKAALRCAPRVIVHAGFEVPRSLKRALWYPAAGAAQTAAGLARQLIKAAGADPRAVRLTVDDPGGNLGDEVCSLLPLAAEVGVVTGHCERYKNAAETAMEQYGAALVFPREVPPDGVTFFVPCRCPPGGKYPLLRANNITVYGIFSLPEHSHFHAPTGVDALTFAWALGSLCGEKSVPGELECSLEVRGASVTAAGAARLLGSVLPR